MFRPIALVRWLVVVLLIVGAIAAMFVEGGYHWFAMLLLATLYLAHREVYMGRLADQQRHVSDINRMHQETIDALSQARQAERALAEEKERLADALAEMTRLENARSSAEMDRQKLANISVIQPAYAPLAPVSPRPMLNLVVAVVIGGGLAVGAALAMERLSPSL